MMSIMTGRPSQAHGVDQHDRALSTEIETLAEGFAALGYRTAAFVPEVTLRAEFGFERGFELFDEQRYGHQRLSSPEMLGKVMDRIESWKDERFFIWAHLWDPHYNYTPPESFAIELERGRRPASEDVQCLKWVRDPVEPDEAEFLLSRHEAEVRYTDRYVGELLDFLDRSGVAEQTIVVLVSDHGEAFLEHGWLGHTNRLDEVLVRVPMMIRWPSRLTPKRVDDVVSTASVGRTLLGLVHGGASDFGVLPGLPDTQATTGWTEPRRVAIAETRRRGCLTSVTDGRFKLTVEHRGCETRLFDLSADPLETTDVRTSHPADEERLRAALSAEIARLEALREEPVDLSASAVPDNLDALRSLGYVQGNTGEVEGGAVVDPCSAAGELPRDSFGDLVLTDSCPVEGVRRCL
jgi:arylsulfatase A-like enzyme